MRPWTITLVCISTRKDTFLRIGGRRWIRARTLDATRSLSMATERVTDRSLLRFAEEVKDRFSFLGALCFYCVRAEATFVRFESPRVSINVFHGRHSFEIDLEIEPAQSSVDACSFLKFFVWLTRKGRTLTVVCLRSPDFCFFKTKTATPEGRRYDLPTMRQILSACCRRSFLLLLL